MPVFAFVEQMQVKVGQLWKIGVWIMCDVLLVIAINPFQAIVQGKTRSISAPFKQVALPYSCEYVHAFNNRNLLRMRQKHPHHSSLLCLVAPEHGKGIMVAGFEEPG